VKPRLEERRRGRARRRRDVRVFCNLENLLRTHSISLSPAPTWLFEKGGFIYSIPAGALPSLVRYHDLDEELWRLLAISMCECSNNYVESAEKTKVTLDNYLGESDFCG
jgi:hypothetical protein